MVIEKLLGSTVFAVILSGDIFVTDLKVATQIYRLKLFLC